MKMGITIIGGIFFLLIGASLIAKVIFKVDIPIFRIFIALFFVYLGLRMLFGDMGVFRSHTDSNSAIFSESNIVGDIEDRSEYNAIFGKVRLDLRDVQLKEIETRVTVNAVFGGAEVLINADMPIKIKSDVVFGGAKLPDRESGGFGTSKYTSDNFDSSQQHLYLDINAVFGGVNIIRY
jgi:predicted membrane protein